MSADVGGGDAAPRALGVAALLLAATDALQSRLGAVAVRGELSGFTRAASGHCYFALKDSDGANALLRCAMFRRAASLLDFGPRDGQQVEVRGRIAIYEPRGELQCVVEAMLPLGAGSLYELFLRQKARLEAAGLFDAARKRQLPSHPRAVGVISSTAGAALHDVLTTLARRAPQVRVIVYPSAVQGAEAPAQLVQALQRAGERREVDTLIVCRGGGSIEDLWAFNDEAVVRAIAASALPVVCGVGHETDVTLADLAADLRAATPTAAAELAAPARDELLQALAGQARRLQRAQRQRIDREAQGLDLLATRLAHAMASLRPQRQRLELLAQRGQAALRQHLHAAAQSLSHLSASWQRAASAGFERRNTRLASLADRLALLDPQQVLSRGYALVENAARQVVTAPSQLRAGERLTISLAQGRADLIAREVKPRVD
ncbi:MAG: exodeoxyribonuclease VII large subunit [Burkholderiaceae bacterium]|nr:MAG: exodeoxyribonuclease VII large subunit [Burkholderiaceae bacterium]MBE7427105.1 exodeoxyribonuclease VII large subunit [Ideonella sp.]MCC7286072.1 exodeoxyribonuclease VII large subunit [Burkholderiaceae bacterium]